MRQLTRNAKQSELEKKKKASEQKEKLIRDEYLDRLKNDKRFQKYIVEEIIISGLNELTDISKFPNSSFADLSELGNLVMQSKIAKASVEKMLSRILNN